MLAHVLSLIGFALASSMTPGPNNLLLAASGIRFGLRATVPHMVGVHVGYSAVLAAVGLGLGAAFARYPAAQDVLRLLGTGYVFYLAWRILRHWSFDEAPGAEPDSAARSRPVRFTEAFLFQFVNPKGVIMAVTVYAAYGLPGASTVTNMTLIIATFAVVNVLSVVTWAGFGAAAQGLARREPAASIIRWTLTILTVASIATLYL